jgi:hypothetical protein
MEVEPSLREPAMLLAFDGWNDAGESASSAVSFVERAIGAVPLAEIDPEEYFDFTVRRPDVAQTDAGRRRIEWPAYRFRFGALDAERELVTGRGAEPHLRWRSFTRCVLELARRVGVRRVVLVGAYLADIVYSRPVTVTGFASRPGLLERLGAETSGYQGPTGIVGVLGDAFDREGIELVSLWAGLPHYINAAPNPRGALALVQMLGRCLDLKLDEEPLRKLAAEFEERISTLVANDPDLSEYVRQLKKREFAQ